MALIDILLLFTIAIGASIVGAIIGAGGGFVFTPILILMGYEPVEAVSMSLVMVLANAISASYIYQKQRRIKIKHGILYGLLTLPGVLIGAKVLLSIDIRTFRFLFGLFLAATSSYIILKEVKQRPIVENRDGINGEHGSFRRSILIPPAVGVISSMFGVGGGILMAPAFIYLAEIPTHIATATSQFITIFTSTFGITTYLTLGELKTTLAPTIIAAGAIGGLIGARISKKMKSKTIKLTIATALIITAIQIILRNLQ